MAARQMRVVDHDAEIHDWVTTAVEVEAAHWLPSTSEVRVAVGLDVIEVSTDSDCAYTEPRQRPGGWWYGTCACGWISVLSRDTRSEADSDAEQHASATVTVRQITGWVILLTIESPVLQPRFFSASRRIPDGAPPRPIVTETVRDCLRELADRRSQLGVPMRPVVSGG